jgi:hypothetical protein
MNLTKLREIIHDMRSNDFGEFQFVIENWADELEELAKEEELITQQIQEDKVAKLDFPISWHSIPPSKPGFYWLYPKTVTEPIIVQINDHEEVYYVGNPKPYTREEVFERDAFWNGPLRYPCFP